MLLLQDNGFIGDQCYSSSIDWRDGRDLEIYFLDNLKIYPSLQYFLDKKITYDFNEYGHRCKSIKDIDLDNYVLFVGCSHTEGTALHITDTFPYILSNRMRMDYYNLGLRGAGMDVQLHNLMTWTLRVKQPPKMLIWQWTLEPRITVLDESGKLECLGSWSQKKSQLDFLIAADEVDYLKTKREFTKAILSNMPFPTIQIDVCKNQDVIYYQRLDFARDMLHYGPRSNQALSDVLNNEISTKYSIG